MPEELTATAPAEGAESAPSSAAPTTAESTPAPFDWSRVPEDAWNRIPTDRLGRLRHEVPEVKQWWQSEVGREAKREADKRLAEHEAERAQQERQRLRREDPEKYAELDEQREQETARRATLEGEFYGALLNDWETLPQPVRDKLGNKDYGRGATGVAAYAKAKVEALADYHAAEQLSKEVAKREKDIRADERRRVLAEMNGGEPPADIDGGAPTGRREYTRAQIEKMSLEEFRKHETDIDHAAREGRIK